MGDDLELDMVVRAQERTEPRHQPVRGERRTDRQLDDAARLLPVADTAASARSAAAAIALDMLAKLAALRGQRKTFIGAREQGNAELAFQLGDLAADRRMAGAQPPRRAAKLRVSATATKVLHRSQSIGPSRRRALFIPD